MSFRVINIREYEKEIIGGSAVIDICSGVCRGNNRQRAFARA